MAKSADDTDILLANSEGGFNRPFVSFPLKPARSNELLDGCWESKENSHREIGNSDSGSRRIGFSSVTYCFQNNGRFRLRGSSTVSISGGNSSVTAGTVGSKLFEISGKYNINNHILELITVNGERGITVFGWHQNTELKQSLVIGGSNFEPR